MLTGDRFNPSGVLTASYDLELQNYPAERRVYGVMSYAVTRRTREIGVRIALGATASQVSSLVAGDGLRLALAGVAIGGALSLPIAYALGALLFGVQIADVAAFALTCAVLVGVALIASWLPARRAARLDPVLALRTE